MALEVMPRAGQLHARDVRVILGPYFSKADHVDVLLLGQPGGQPSAARVVLADLPGGGRGVHRGLVCPQCLAPKLMLLTNGSGGLGCSSCLRHRTRRQRERTLAAWKKYDAELEDELFRRLSGQRSTSPATVARAREIIEEIVAGDLDRVAALAPHVRAALMLAAMTEVGS
jgi:hypothetical protein